MTPADRIASITAVAVSEANDELTIILSALTEELQHADLDARVNLRSAKEAAERCMWNLARVAQFCNRSGGRAVAASSTALIQRVESGMDAPRGVVLEPDKGFMEWIKGRERRRT